MKNINLSIRSFITPVLFVLACILYPAAFISAQQEEAADTQEVMDKANHLKGLLDSLLSNPNSSSIQKIVKNGDEHVKSLIYKAQELKVRGEVLLNEKKYLEAAVHFQSSMEYVIQAIREQKSKAKNPQVIKAKLEQKLKTNETFISAATRVLKQDYSDDAVKLLKMAKEARIRAVADSKQGNDQEALVEVENSTRLAQQAIKLVRQGKVIERK